MVSHTHVNAELPAAAASVLQEPGDQLVLTEASQSLDLQHTAHQNQVQDQDQRQLIDLLSLLVVSACALF